MSSYPAKILRKRNWTIAKSGSDVVIKCESVDDALAVFNWLTEFAAQQDTRVSKARAERCVTHSYACDCREYRYEQMRDALANIWIWAESDSKSGETRQKAMDDIAEACRKALEH